MSPAWTRQNWREAEDSFFLRAFFSNNLTSFAAKKDPAVIESGRVRAMCKEVEVVVAAAKLPLEAATDSTTTPVAARNSARTFRGWVAAAEAEKAKTIKQDWK